MLIRIISIIKYHEMHAVISKDDFVVEGEEIPEGNEPKQSLEDEIPDLPENQAAREFLRTAPTHGLPMPLGKAVKVMQCWRCKAFGHRTGDPECPLNKFGNYYLDAQRQAREDPMSTFVAELNKLRQEKLERVEQLKILVEEIRAEEAERKERKRARRSHKKEKKKSRRK